MALGNVHFNSSSNYVVASRNDGCIDVWDAVQKERISSWKGHSLECWTGRFKADDPNVVYSGIDNNLDRLYSFILSNFLGSDDSLLKIWDLRSGYAPSAAVVIKE